MIAVHILVAFCSFVSLLYLFAALGSDNWMGDSSIRYGLWQVCNGRICRSESVPAYLPAIRIVMYLGIIAGVVSLVGLCISSCNKFNSCTAYVNFIAGFCVMIVIIIFYFRADPTYQFGPSFQWTCTSFVLYLLIGLFIYGMRDIEI